MAKWTEGWQKFVSRTANKIALSILILVIGLVSWFATIRTNWPEAWQKFLDKRLDMTVSFVANFASTAVVAFFSGLILWEWNKRREQRAEREEWRDRNAEKKAAHLRLLEADRENFAVRAERAGNAREAGDVADSWQVWLKQHTLESKGTNLQTAGAWHEMRIGFSFQSDPKKTRSELAAAIRATSLE